MKSHYSNTMLGRVPGTNKILTVEEIKKAVQTETDSVIDKVYQEVKQDVAAQIIAVVLVELSNEFGFGKKRLNTFYSGVNGLFRLMQNNGIFGKEFTPINCIEMIREKYNIDLDKKVKNNDRTEIKS